MLGYGIQETTTTTGTGTLTLSQVSGYPRFADAFAVGDLVEYSLLDSNGKPLECGIGTVGASNTLARTYPLVTFSGGTYDNTNPTALSLSGTTTVICTGSPGGAAAAAQAFYTSGGYRAASVPLQPPNAYAGFSGTCVANTVYCVPIQHQTNKPCAGIQCRVTGTAGTSAMLGLYRAGASGYPTDLLQSGTIATNSSGIKQLSFSAWYPPGWYYVAAVADAAVNFNTWSSGAAIMQPNILGVNSNNIHNSHLTLANGSINLPDPFTAGASVIDAQGTIPQVNITIVYAP